MKQSNTLIDETGNTYGKLRIISKVPKPEMSKDTHARWLCRCECGNTTSVDGCSLRSGKTTSCGCVYLTWKSERPEVFQKLPYQWVYYRLLSNAKRSKRECKLTYKEFVSFTTTKNCHYCGEPIQWIPHRIKKMGKGISGNYHLDRINNNEGYTKENCVVCCKSCNFMKGSMSQDKFLLHIEKIHCHQVISSVPLISQKS